MLYVSNIPKVTFSITLFRKEDLVIFTLARIQPRIGSGIFQDLSGLTKVRRDRSLYVRCLLRSDPGFGQPLTRFGQKLLNAQIVEAFVLRAEKARAILAKAANSHLGFFTDVMIWLLILC